MAFDYKGGISGGLGGAATGAAIGSVVPGIGTAIGAGVGGLLGLFSGGSKEKKEKIRQQQLYSKEQLPLYQQLLASGAGPGAGGAFGESADYYRDLLSDDSHTANAMFQPELRRFNEEIVPGLAEQFAGMGSGGLSSSGFRNAAVNAGTDLSERLGAIRANLRQQAASGLSNIGSMGLGRFHENVRNTPQAGFGQNLAEGVGQALPSLASAYFSQPSGGQLTSAQPVGAKTSPYGQQGSFSSQLPSFNPYMRG
jgi:hypothetical protein